MSWEETEYKECSADWRYRDRLIWATPPILITVSGALVGIAYGTLRDNPEARLIVLAIASIFAYLMMLSLVRHRMFQEGSREQMESLRIKLKIDENWDKNPRKHYPKKYEVRFLNWLTSKKRSGARTQEKISLVIFCILTLLTLYNLATIIYNLFF